MSRFFAKKMQMCIRDRRYSYQSSLRDDLRIGNLSCYSGHGFISRVHPHAYRYAAGDKEEPVSSACRFISGKLERYGVCCLGISAPVEESTYGNDTESHHYQDRQYRAGYTDILDTTYICLLYTSQLQHPLPIATKVVPASFQVQKTEPDIYHPTLLNQILPLFYHIAGIFRQITPIHLKSYHQIQRLQFRSPLRILQLPRSHHQRP